MDAPEAPARLNENMTLGISADDEALLTKYFGDDVRTTIIKFHDRIQQTPDAKAGTFGAIYSKPIVDRQLRTAIHKVGLS